MPTARRATRLSSEIARGSAPSGGYVRRPGSPLRARQGVPGGPPPPSFVASPRAHGLRDRRARPFSRPVACHRCGGGVGRHGVPGIPRSHQLGPCQSPSTRRLGGRHRPHHRLRRRSGHRLASWSSGRALVNEFWHRWSGHEEELAASPEASGQLIAACRRGDYNLGYVYADQGVGMLRQERAAATVVAEAEALLARWAVS